MTKYLALLRGINISGKNKITMPDLRLAFTEKGFQNVSTYINSGNVLFSSEEAPTELPFLCRDLVKEKFALSIPVCVLSEQELRDALSHAPSWWDMPDEEEQLHQMIFVLPPYTASEVFETMGKAKDDYEKIACYDQSFYWSAKRNALSKTRWYKIASTSANEKVTIRNASTVKKLWAMMQKTE